jgi:hypothetical protein
MRTPVFKTGDHVKGTGFTPPSLKDVSTPVVITKMSIVKHSPSWDLERHLFLLLPGKIRSDIPGIY